VAFEAALDPRFVYRTENPDYGLDGEVEEFDAQDRATGIRFHVQLKATATVALNEALAVSIELDTAEYYRSLAMPVLMVRYHAPSGHLYTRWFHQYDPYYGRGGEKTLTFRWEEEDVWEEGRPEQLVAEVRAFRELRSAQVPLPVDLYLQQEGEVAGVSALEMGFGLGEAASARPDVLRFQEGPPPAGAARIEVRPDEMVANLGQVGTATLHVDGDYQEPVQTMATDALVLTALAFSHVGQADLAARLAETYLADSSLVRNPEVAMGLSRTMSRARRIRESLDLSERLDQSGDDELREASMLFTLPALAHGVTLTVAERESHWATLQARIDRRLAADERVLASREYLNLGNALRKSHEPHRGVEMYRRALECDPEYAQRAHYWYELGGVLFGAEEYEESAEAYARALEMGSDSFALALQADATLFAGRYADALELLAQFNASQQEHGAEYRLKEGMTRYIVEELGIDRQDRDPQAAEEIQRGLAGRQPEDEMEALLGALDLDALDPDAWRNLAQGAMALQDPRVVVFTIAAASLRENDQESWVMGIAMAVATEDEALLRDVVATGAFRCGPSLRTGLATFFRQFEPASERDRFLEQVAEIWSEVAPVQREGFTLRLLREGGQVEEIPIQAPEPDEDSGAA
jgi:tetratricopeptide (TPR) repeat protein